MIETLIVVMLVGILAAIVVPSVRASQRAMRLRTAPITVAAKLGEARTNAIKRNQPTWLLLDGANGTVQVQTTGATGTVNIGPVEYLPPGVNFSLGGAPTATVLFDSMGRPSPPPQTVQMQQPSTSITRTITVTPTGRITIN